MGEVANIWRHYNGGKSGHYQRLAVGAVGGCSRVADGGARLYFDYFLQKNNNCEV